MEVTEAEAEVVVVVVDVVVVVMEVVVVVTTPRSSWSVSASVSSLMTPEVVSADTGVAVLTSSESPVVATSLSSFSKHNPPPPPI